jgi:hypothetical protein
LKFLNERNKGEYGGLKGKRKKKQEGGRGEKLKKKVEE